MDKLAHGLVNQANEIHRKGYSANRNVKTLGGEGINFFSDVRDVKDASLKLIYQKK